MNFAVSARDERSHRFAGDHRVDNRASVGENRAGHHQLAACRQREQEPMRQHHRPIGRRGTLTETGAQSRFWDRSIAHGAARQQRALSHQNSGLLALIAGLSWWMNSSACRHSETACHARTSSSNETRQRVSFCRLAPRKSIRGVDGERAYDCHSRDGDRCRHDS
jgi:hypothetical protein